jgi:hypothetical protein
MMKIFFGFFVLLLVSFSVSSAQVTATNSKSENFNSGITGLGFSGGTASGVGVSFRYHSTTKASFQIVGGVFRPQTSETFGSIGFEYQHDLVRSNASRFFAAGASSYLFNGTGETNTYAGPFRAGAGLGGEFSIQEGVHFTFEALFTYFSDGTILPLPQLAFHYYFY